MKLIKEHLLQTITNSEFYQKLKYNPFKIPADIQQAETHAKARRVSKHSKISELCPCCNMPIDNEQISICCNDNELAFLGYGFSLYFFFLKCVIVLILICFFVSGSAVIFFTNFQCKAPKKCEKLFFIPIWNEDSNLKAENWNINIASVVMILIIYCIKTYIFKF